MATKASILVSSLLRGCLGLRPVVAKMRKNEGRHTAGWLGWAPTCGCSASATARLSRPSSGGCHYIGWKNPTKNWLQHCWWSLAPSSLHPTNLFHQRVFGEVFTIHVQLVLNIFVTSCLFPDWIVIGPIVNLLTLGLQSTRTQICERNRKFISNIFV